MLNEMEGSYVWNNGKGFVLAEVKRGRFEKEKNLWSGKGGII